MPDTALRVLLCTAPEAEAPALARSLLEARLIGCANLLPKARSLYWWEGAIQDDAEVLMIMETPADKAPAAMEALAAAHPYEVPKILCLPVEAVNAPYRAWLEAACSS